MAFVALLIVAAALGAYGYFRGAVRLLLALVPLVVASFLLWLLGPLLYRLDALRNVGLAWPAFTLLCTGLALGYVLQFLARRKLPKSIHRADRISGSVVGVLLSLILVWLGCVYTVALAVSRGHAMVGGSTEGLARALDAAVLRWIPVVGSGSAAMMDLLEISSADEQVRQYALRELGLDRLFDAPQVRAVLDDAETRKEIEAAAGGSMPALWRLQKDRKIMELVESQEIREALEGHSLDEIVKAIRKAKQESAPGR